MYIAHTHFRSTVIANGSSAHEDLREAIKYFINIIKMNYIQVVLYSYIGLKRLKRSGNVGETAVVSITSC